MLLFKKQFLQAIREGRKTQTIRLWKRRMFRAGQRSYIPGAGYIRIESVDVVALDELTEEDARRDGFESLVALRREIDRLYPRGLADGVQAYRLIFALLSPEEQASARQERQKRKASIGLAAKPEIG
jgi:hypothetical protein